MSPAVVRSDCPCQQSWGSARSRYLLSPNTTRRAREARECRLCRNTAQKHIAGWGSCRMYWDSIKSVRASSIYEARAVSSQTPGRLSANVTV